jgi:hypothetical protein
MSKGTWFWIIYVISILLICFNNWYGSSDSKVFVRGSLPWVLAFILWGLLGWAEFGALMK